MTSVVRECQRDWSKSKNNMYRTLGFDFVKYMAPSCFYIDIDPEFPIRLPYTKYLTEDFCLTHLQIFDSGKIKFICKK
jgi:hypothetical protein